MTNNNDNISITKPIVLVGLMGAGKTSIGRMLSKKLHIPFVDSDQEIELASKSSIIDVFTSYGEDEFRQLEKRVIERIFTTEPSIKVISTGEGAFLTPVVHDLILNNAISIWLKADLNLLIKRTNFKHTRPQLLNTDPAKILKQLMIERHPVYADANICVETKDENLRQTLSNTLNSLKEYVLNNNI